MLINFNKNKKFTLPIPFNELVGIETAKCFKNLPTGVEELIIGIAGCSPYLKTLLIMHKSWLQESILNKEFDIISELDSELINANDLFKSLRVCKSKMALWTAFCDLSGLWDLDAVTQNLTRFADLVVEHCMEFEFKKIIKFNNSFNSIKKLNRSGWVAIAMGKMGAFELNYSSDIDLIFLFDDSVYRSADFEEIRMAFIRMTRAVSKMLNETSSAGYVFRTDFRLRPNPSVTPICLSMDAAMRYYESYGRAWERAAFIKARACAGDISRGKDFLNRLKPFVWRKHLDFVAIQEAHDIRMKIREHTATKSKKKFFGRNIKLSEGGIRDIEFFAQTRQMIAGGRDISLRSPRTCEAITNLEKSGWIEQKDHDSLINAYYFFRNIEHRLQMINDVQTHDLPMSSRGINRISSFMGFKNPLEFKKKVEFNLRLVSSITNRFFSPKVHKNKVPENYLKMSDGWLYVPALRSEKAKGIFKKIRPVIIEKAILAGSPEITLARFTQFLEGLPSGFQLFSLFDSNPELIELLLDICSSGIKLSTYLANNSKVFDSVLDGDFFEKFSFDKKFSESLHNQLKGAPDYEEKLNLARVIHNELHFKIGVQYLKGLLNAEEVSWCYSNLAKCILSEIWSICCDDFFIKHGALVDSGAVVMGMGSLGSQTMNASSDVDLILIYDALNDSRSDGEKSLEAPVYYSRLTQKFLTAISAKMPDGSLYKVDMRLRPSGKNGPVATSLTAFMNYQANDAWIWERLAFTRARVVCGNDNLKSHLNSFRSKLLNKNLNKHKIFSDIVSLRERVSKTYTEAQDFPWDIKKGVGGVFDLQLLGQGCALTFNIKSYDTIAHLSALSKLDDWSNYEAKKLIRLYFLMFRLNQIFALIGEYKDLDLFKTKLCRDFVLRETGSSSINELKLELGSLRKSAHEMITVKLKTIIKDNKVGFENE